MNSLAKPKMLTKQHGVIAAALTALLLLVPGCSLPKLRQADCGAPLPEYFKEPTSPGSSASLGVDEFFNDPTLVGLIDEALVGNQELKILNQDIEIANNEILRRRGLLFPLLSLDTRARINKYSYNTIEGSDNRQGVPIDGSSFPKPLPDFMVAGNITWQIDIWRQLRNARDAQQLRYLGTIDGRTYTVTRLVAEVAENYYSLMALDKRMENLNRIITLQQQSLKLAEARKEFARDTELAVQRFEAEVRKNQSERFIISQEIVETENQINFLAGRFPQRVERSSNNFLDLNLPELMVGVPSELLQNRPDIRQAERELQASGLDVKVMRANFYPKLIMSAGGGFEAFNTKYLFESPDSLIYNAAGNLAAPLVNRAAIKADYMNANARQLQAIYDYQRTVLNAFTEVVNRISRVHNYSMSIDVKKQQLSSLETAVDVASNLFTLARPGVDYMDVLLAQRDLVDARKQLIDTKEEQLAAIVNAYQALGGGATLLPYPGAPGGANGVCALEILNRPLPANGTAVEELPPVMQDPAPQNN